MGKIISLANQKGGVGVITSYSIHYTKLYDMLVVNYVNYLADINYGYVSYARSYDSIGNFAVGMHYINYGNFLEATKEGDLTGNESYNVV